MLSSVQSIYLILGHTDMRKSIDTLSIQLQFIENINIFDGSMFVFCNKRKNIIKILYYDRNGFCLFQKRIEKIKFDWPDNKDTIKNLKIRELRWLLDGLVLKDIKDPGDENYSRII